MHSDYIFSLILLVISCVAQIQTQNSDSVVSKINSSISCRFIGKISFYLYSIEQHREFRVDYHNNRFLKDGEPFRYVSGSFHYYRTMPGQWRQRFRTMRAAGLNAISTYVEWSMHNPSPDAYVWNEMADLEQFIRLAAEEDLLVILRVGPFICSERDMVRCFSSA